MKYLIALSLVLTFFGTSAQTDIYNLKNSIRFGEYLLASHNFKAASAEFERVVFLAPEEEIFKQKLFYTYRKALDYETGIRRFADLYPSKISLNPLINKEIALMYLYRNQFLDFQQFTHQNPLPAQIDTTLMVSFLLLQERYPEARTYIESTSHYPQLQSLVLRANELPLKNPNLALGLSVIIPGAGKVYAGQWKDGLFSLVFTGLSAWQAVRGFNKDGVHSFYGWLYSGISLGFYAGNLYGSYKAVSKYNYQLKHEISHDVQDILLDLE